MGMGPKFDVRSVFRRGDVRLFCQNPRLKDVFPQHFPQIPCRLFEREWEREGLCLWSYEDLRTGEISDKSYNQNCFSLNKLTEMEVLAWAAK